VPSHQEFLSLINAGSSWTTLNGVSGRLFGTAPNQIFLPAVGWRIDGAGTLNGAGTIGRYWSATQDPGGFDAWMLQISSGGASRIPEPRFWGFSVRCVRRY
jgi:hypothetical protein